MYYHAVSILATCGINGCTTIVEWKYEPEEPMTRDFPGYLGYWYPDNHDDHADELMYDAIRIDFIACSSFDDLMPNYKSLEDLAY